MITQNGPSSTGSQFYVAGGTLSYDHPSYVEREADRELFEALQRGEFCYVLTSRQMGKSSLMNRTARRLTEQGVQTAILDLTALGENQTADQWYEGLLGILGYRLGLEEELEGFWLGHERVGPLRRWVMALREVVLPQLGIGSRVLGIGNNPAAGIPQAPPSQHPTPNTQQPIPRLVIFIDEIDAVRSLPFSADELFAAIRECYNRRTDDPEFQRLTFCLLGVATPSDLIRDTRKTPFNIGRRTDLTDFSETEAAPLGLGLAGEGARERGGEKTAEALLKRVLYWTGGHPYLTQRLCQVVAEAVSSPTLNTQHPTPALVDRLCGELFLSRRARERDDNLLFVRERLLRSEVDRAALLDLYAQVRSGKRVPCDETNEIASILRLSGIARVVNGRLAVRNRIYERVFDREWIAQHMPGAELRRQRVAYRRGLLRAAMVGGTVAIVMASLALTAVSQTQKAEAASAEAIRTAQTEQQLRAQLAAKNDQLGEALRSAMVERNRASQAAHQARIAQRSEYSQRLQAEAASQEARRQKDTAERQRAIAVAHQVRARHEKMRAERQERIARQRGEESRRRLVRLNLANGIQRMNDGDVLGSLPWLAEAAMLDEKTPRASVHRMRLAAVLQRCPKLVQVWFHKERVSYAEFSPDGHRVVTASDDHTAQVWDVVTGTPVTPLLPHNDSVNDAAFSPDGRRVVTASSDHTARVWDAATGRPITPPLQHAGLVWHAVFSPNGRRVATASDDQAGRIWDATTGAPIATCALANAAGPLRDHTVEFSPDGRRVLTAYSAIQGAAIEVWEAETGKAILTVSPGAQILGASFSPDGRRIVMTQGSREAHVLDAATGTPALPPLKQNGFVMHAVFSPDGRRIATATNHRTAQVWDAATGTPVAPPLEQTGEVPQKRRSLAFSPDSRSVAVLAGDTTQVWDAATGERSGPPLQHGGPVSHAAFGPDGRHLLTASGDHSARVWDLAGGEPDILRLQASMGHGEFSPDGRRVVTSSGWGFARVWDAATAEPVTPRLMSGRVEYACLSPDGRRVLTASWADKVAQVWDAATGRRLTLPMKHDDLVRFAAFSPDGRHVVTASDDDTARVWDAATGRPITPLLQHRGDVRYAAFSPDNRRVVTASWDGTAQVWDAATGRRVVPPLKHGGPVNQVSFGPDGRRILTASDDTTAAVWDAATGRRALRLRHTAGVRLAIFSTDGHRILTAAGETVQVWDAVTGRRAALPIHLGVFVWDAALSRDGRLVATAGYDKTARVWDATTGDPLTPPLKHDAGVFTVAFSPGGRRVLTGGHDPFHAGALGPYGGRIWNLHGDPRPLRDLVQLAQVLSGHRIDPNAGFVPVEPEALHRLWQSVRSRYPGDCSATPQQVFAWHQQEADDAERDKEWSTAIAHLDRTIEASPASWVLHARRAAAYAELSQWEQAAAGYAKAVELGAEDHRVWYDRALLQLTLGDTGGYRDTCERLLDRFEKDEDLLIGPLVAATCALAAEAVRDKARPVASARQMATFPWRGVLNSLGAALYRAGQFAEALRRLNEATTAPDRDAGTGRAEGSVAYNALFLAMCHHRLGRAAEARQWLDRGVQELEQVTQPDTAGGLVSAEVSRRPLHWWIRIELQLLRREAETLLGVGR